MVWAVDMNENVTVWLDNVEWLHCIWHISALCWQYLTDLVAKNQKQHGLEPFQTVYDQEDIWICHAHQSCLQTSASLTKVPLDSLGKYAQFVSSINFGSNDIQELPEDFFLCVPGAIDLNFNYNKLRRLPKGIPHCKKLRFVQFSNNCLEDLPEDFGDSESLWRLDISSNPMKRLPPVVTRMTKLHKLYIQKMLFTGIKGRRHFNPPSAKY